MYPGARIGLQNFLLLVACREWALEARVHLGAHIINAANHLVAQRHNPLAEPLVELPQLAAQAANLAGQFFEARRQCTLDEPLNRATGSRRCISSTLHPLLPR